MNSSSDFVSVKGAMGLIKKSKNFYAPIFEALANSFEAINSKHFKNDESPSIKINFYFSGMYSEARDFEKLEIIDNGVGFSDDDYKRYKTLLDKSKGYNNRGSGRLQFLHRFQKIEVDSNFEIEGKFYKRTFISNENNLASDPLVIPAQSVSSSSTQITFTGLKESKLVRENFDILTVEEIQNEIKNKFLLKLYLEKKKDLTTPKIEISFLKNNVIEKKLTIDSADIPEPENEGDIEIRFVKSEGNIENKIVWHETQNSEILKWAHWKLPEDQLDKNGIFLCSKDVALEELSLLKIKKSESIAGHRHLTAIYGEILDKAEYVSDSVDEFLFPSIKQVEKEANEDLFFEPGQEYMFKENIENGIRNALPRIYPEIGEMKIEQDKRIDYLAEMHGIPLELVQSVSIDLSDSDEKILDKIYKKQAEENSKNNFKIQKLYDGLIDLSPNSTAYHEELESKGKELLELIPLQNKEELARYIIRREMVTKIVGLILSNELKYQNTPISKGKKLDKEGLIHDLIFKRKNHTAQGLNDLWILNEEFLHYTGYSDLELSKIKFPDGTNLIQEDIDETELLKGFKIQNKKLKRPDIFLFPEEGKCILIEFKAHDVDLSDHLNQLTKYCNLIANVATKKIDSFYCYLIGQVIERIDLPGEFTRTVYNDFVKPSQPVKSIKPGQEDISIANIYQEIVQLSNISVRAQIRNKSFADKLGLRIDQVPLSND